MMAAFLQYGLNRIKRESLWNKGPERPPSIFTCDMCLWCWETWRERCWRLTSYHAFLCFINKYSLDTSTRVTPAPNSFILCLCFSANLFIQKWKTFWWVLLMLPVYMLLLNAPPPPIFNFDLLAAMKVLIQRLQLSTSYLKFKAINQIEAFTMSLKLGEKYLLCWISTQRRTVKGLKLWYWSNKFRSSFFCASVNTDVFQIAQLFCYFVY